MNQEPARRIFLREFRSISRAISTYEDFGVLVNHFAEGISKSFQVKGCSIMILDERDQQLYRVSSYGVSDRYLSKGPVFLYSEDAAFVEGKPVFIEDTQNDFRIQYPEDAAHEGIASMLSVPIKCRESVIGLIRIYHSEKWLLHDDDLDSFCVLAMHLGLVIENNGLRNFLEGVKHAMESLPPRMLSGL
jgi:transcriptional regulator with GAF, ATPase, and Fis domain